MPMRAARYPLGRKNGLADTATLTSDDAMDAGFSAYKALPLEYLFGTAHASEWVPDAGERQALAAGARLRILTLTKTPVPLKVGVSTSLPDDTITATDARRIDTIARRLYEDAQGGDWAKASAQEKANAVVLARAVTRLVFEEFAR